MATGGIHTCALMSGGVKCWGNNYDGQLGNGTTTSNTPNPQPVDVIGLRSGVMAITVGIAHTCGVTNSGGIKCWGYNAFGQLGDGTYTARYTPVDVIGFGGFYQLYLPSVIR